MKYFPARAYHRKMLREADLDLEDDPMPSEVVSETSDENLGWFGRVKKANSRNKGLRRGLIGILGAGIVGLCVSFYQYHYHGLFSEFHLASAYSLLPQNVPYVDDMGFHHGCYEGEELFFDRLLIEKFLIKSLPNNNYSITLSLRDSKRRLITIFGNYEIVDDVEFKKLREKFGPLGQKLKNDEPIVISLNGHYNSNISGKLDINKIDGINLKRTSPETTPLDEKFSY